MNDCKNSRNCDSQNNAWHFSAHTTSLRFSLSFSMKISMMSCPRSWFLMRFLVRFLILNEVLAQDLTEILILEQSHWDFDEKIFFSWETVHKKIHVNVRVETVWHKKIRHHFLMQIDYWISTMNTTMTMLTQLSITNSEYPIPIVVRKATTENQNLSFSISISVNICYVSSTVFFLQPSLIYLSLSLPLSLPLSLACSYLSLIFRFS